MKKVITSIIFIFVFLLFISCRKTVSVTIGSAEETEDKGTQLILEGKSSEALEYFTEKLNTSINNNGENSIEAIETYNDLGLVLSGLGELERAKEYYSKAAYFSIEIQNNSNLIIAYSGLAKCYQLEGEYEMALGYVTKEREIADKIYGKDSFRYADTVSDESLLYRYMGEYQTALELGEKSLKLMLNTSGEDKYDVIDRYYMNIGHIYYNKGDYDNASHNYNEALKLRERLYGDECYQTAGSYLAYGRSIVRENQTNARQFFEKALSVYEKDEEYNPARIVTLRNISWSYILESNYEDAMKYAIQAYKGAEEAGKPLKSHKELLYELYESMGIGKDEDFEDWLKEKVN